MSPKLVARLQKGRGTEPTALRVTRPKLQQQNLQSTINLTASFVTGLHKKGGAGPYIGARHKGHKSAVDPFAFSNTSLERYIIPTKYGPQLYQPKYCVFATLLDTGRVKKVPTGKAGCINASSFHVLQTEQTLPPPIPFWFLTPKNMFWDEEVTNNFISACLIN